MVWICNTSEMFRVPLSRLDTHTMVDTEILAGQLWSCVGTWPAYDQNSLEFHTREAQVLQALPLRTKSLCRSYTKRKHLGLSHPALTMA